MENSLPLDTSLRCVQNGSDGKEALLANEKDMNVIRESHLEVCFSRLNGKVLMTSKSEKYGVNERVQVLSLYLQDLSVDYVRESAKSLGCKPDDFVDTICPAVTAIFNAQGRNEMIPEKPVVDDKGIKMQMIILEG